MTTMLRAALMIAAIAWFSPTHEQGGAERAAGALATAQASGDALRPEALAAALLRSQLTGLRPPGSDQTSETSAMAVLQAAAGRAALAR
jgi:hypothetical protein